MSTIIKALKNLMKKYDLIVNVYDFLILIYFQSLTDEEVIQKQFRKRLGREVKLENPIKYNDKLQ